MKLNSRQSKLLTYISKDWNSATKIYKKLDGTNLYETQKGVVIALNKLLEFGSIERKELDNTKDGSGKFKTKYEYRRK